MQMKVNGRQLTVPPSATSIGFLLGPTGYRPLPVSKQPLRRAPAGILITGIEVVGDIDTFKSVVSNTRTGKRVGLTETSCAIFDIAKPGGHGPPARDMTFHCSSITYLRQGLLTAFGSVAFDHQGRISVRPGVITGGTGRYAGARGWVESHQLSEGKSLDIVHLAPRPATPPLSLSRCQRASR